MVFKQGYLSISNCHLPNEVPFCSSKCPFLCPFLFFRTLSYDSRLFLVQCSIFPPSTFCCRKLQYERPNMHGLSVQQPCSVKPELRFCVGSNPACSVSKIYNVENLVLVLARTSFIGQPYQKKLIIIIFNKKAKLKSEIFNSKKSL